MNIKSTNQRFEEGTMERKGHPAEAWSWFVNEEPLPLKFGDLFEPHVPVYLRECGVGFFVRHIRYIGPVLDDNLNGEC
jgi:hypothetical protein